MLTCTNSIDYWFSILYEGDVSVFMVNVFLFTCSSPTAHGQFFKSPSPQRSDLNFIIDISTNDIEECEFNIS